MTSWVGRRVRAVDWEAKTSGTEQYAGDISLDGQLVGRILRSPVPFARITSIDTTKAARMPGVHAVVTVADLASGKLYIHSGDPYRDRPYLADGWVRYVGEEIAAVAAESVAAADAAIAAMKVKYRRGRAPMTIDEALAPGARALHPRDTGQANVAVCDDRSFGDLDEARRIGVASVFGRYVYPRVGHAPMETNTTLAHWQADGRLHLWTSSQSPWFVAEEMANAFDIQQDLVVCHDVSTGGGFGSKSHVSEHEVIAALLARKARRPVLVALDRIEEFAATKPRHAFVMDLSVHADEAGRLALIEAEVDADNGAYNHYGPSVLRAGVKKFASTYRPTGVRWRARLIDTALPPGGQYRGYGSTQTTFALESAVDELAERIGADPIEFRIANANAAESTALSGIRIGSARLINCLTSVRDEIGWVEKRRTRRPFRGVGVAAAIHGSGAFVYPDANRSEMAFQIDNHGHVQVRFGGADAGTGQRTIIAQIVAEQLGVDIGAVQVTMNAADTFDLGAWSSRGTHISGHAARVGADEVADRLRDAAATKFGCAVADVELRDGQACVGADTVSIAELAGLASPGETFRHKSEYVDKRMERLDAANPSANYSASYTFAAHAVEVEVDPATGQVRVLDYVAAHDIGTALNPTMVEGQIIGGVVQGLGAALGEQVLYEEGRVVNPTFLHYPVPRAPEAPRVRPVLVEGDEPAGPFGAKSVGEIPILPPAPALANAVYDAIGIRFRELPITPDKVLAALRARDGHARRSRIWRRPSRWEVELLRRLYPYGVKALLLFGTRFARRRPPAPQPQLVQPTDISAASQALDKRAMLIAGGTDVTPLRQQRLVAPRTLVSIGNLAELRHHRISPGGWLEIGAATPLAALTTAGDLVPSILADTTRMIASAQIRELATVGGNLLQAKRCWFFRNGFDCYKSGGWTCPCYAVVGDHRYHHAAIGAHRCQAVTPSDLATAFVALDAVVHYRTKDGADGQLAVERLYKGPGESRLPAGALVTCVRVPPDALTRLGVVEKLQRWHGDFAVTSVTIAANRNDDRIGDMRIVLGAMAPTPLRLHAVEQRLSGRSWSQLRVLGPSAVADELDRIAHPLRDNGWKLDATQALAARAFTRLEQLAT